MPGTRDAPTGEVGAVAEAVQGQLLAAVDHCHDTGRGRSPHDEEFGAFPRVDGAIGAAVAGEGSGTASRADTAIPAPRRTFQCT